jgi:UDP-2,3-diacylglucosamine pyrophosphatase LpxH
MSGNTLVLSDVHLGSPSSKTKALTSVLKTEEYSHLILNGDLLDNKHINRYNKHHWNVLGLIRKIAKKKEVTFIRGNHDENSELLSHILGLEFVDQYTKTFGKKKYLFMHFQQFDPFLYIHPLFCHWMEQIYYFIQKIDSSRSFSRWVKRKSKSFMKTRDNIRSKALHHIKNTEFDGIFGGHIHFAETYICPETGKEYYNSGSFCDVPCHYLLIDAEGNVQLKEI